MHIPTQLQIAFKTSVLVVLVACCIAASPRAIFLLLKSLILKIKHQHKAPDR